mmetsp:Transcript_38063/g.59358  ORF Transcript_38063/g.59358 Transcript_38063/m.59358 type:complete len:370 (+) Transcript_38063:28-1137(+)
MAGELLVSPVLRASAPPSSRVPSLLAFGAVALATVALLSNTEFHAQDALLQTAQAQPAFLAPQQVPVAQAFPVQGLQEAAPAAEPAAAVPAAEPAAAVAPEAGAAVPPPPATGNPSNDIFNVPAGSGLATPLPPPAPLCAGGEGTCENAACVETSSIGCLTPDATGQFDCTCPPPPPPPPAPVIGSPGWLSLPENQIEAPGPAAMAGVNLASYKLGDISIQLARYLKNTASKAEAQAEIADIVRDELKRMHTNEESVAPEAPAEGAEGAEGAEAPGKSKGILGLGFFGLAEEGSNTEAAGESKMTVGEARTVAADLKNIINEDSEMPASTKGELKELEEEAKNYNGAGSLKASMLSVVLAAVMALFFRY